jgi:hypothetical protein
VLGLAGDGTRVASDTLSVVDDEAEVHKVELNGMILGQVARHCELCML